MEIKNFRGLYTYWRVKRSFPFIVFGVRARPSYYCKSARGRLPVIEDGKDVAKRRRVAWKRELWPHALHRLRGRPSLVWLEAPHCINVSLNLRTDGQMERCQISKPCGSQAPPWPSPASPRKQFCSPVSRLTRGELQAVASHGWSELFHQNDTFVM